MPELTIGREWRLLTQDEFDTVSESHLENLAETDRGQAVDLLKRLKRLRAKYRDLAHQQRREARGKAAPKGTNPATDNTNTKLKAQVFQKAEQRVKRHIHRIDAEAARMRQRESMERALAGKRAAQSHATYPGSRTERQGFSPTSENAKAPRFLHVDREKGRVSQAVKRAQAKRDAR